MEAQSNSSNEFLPFWEAFEKIGKKSSAGEPDPYIWASVCEGEHTETFVTGIGATWSDYAGALMRATKGASKSRGGYITPAVFKEHYRCGENIAGAGLLGLDIDDAPITIAQIKERLPFASLIYTTWSHGVASDWEERPRLRVLLPLARVVDKDEYAALWRWADHQLGGSVADKSTRDAGRLFYLPREKNPLAACEPIIEDVSGAFLDPDNLPGEISVAALLAKEEEEDRAKEAAKKKAPPFRKEAADVAQAKALQALSVLSPVCHYDIWYKTGLALREEFGEEGIAIWLDWSKGSADYPGEAEARAKLDTFGDSDKTVGLGSLYKFASDNALATVDSSKVGDDYYCTEVLEAAAFLRSRRNGPAGGPYWERVLDKAKGAGGPSRFSDWELAVITRQGEAAAGITKARAVATEKDQKERGIVSNFLRVVDAEGREELRKKDMRDVIADLSAAADGWPKLMDNVLFAPSPTGADRAQFFTQNPALFAWLEYTAGGVDWTDRSVVSTTGASIQPITKQQTFDALAQLMPEADRFEGIASVPHVPPVEGVYYFDRDLPESTGEALADYVALFNPDTPDDRDLIEAMILTGMWGGAPGKRPAFVIASDHGRGAGKTSTAHGVARLYGGAIDVKADARTDALEARLLDPSTAALRFCLIDNLKDPLSSADFEAMITSPAINGKRMYVGDGRRTNLLTWIFTSNTPSLSNDLSERAVVIKIGAQAPGVDFEAATSAFIEERGDALLADIKAKLEGEPRCTIKTHDRWQAWQRAVLSRFERGEELAQLIIERRASVDDDSRYATEIADEIRAHMMNRGWDLDVVHGVIPTAFWADAISAVNGKAVSSRGVHKVLRAYRTVGGLKGRVRGEGRFADTRGWHWVGEHADPQAAAADFREMGPLKDKIKIISSYKKIK